MQKALFLNVTDYYMQVLQIKRLKPSKIQQDDTLLKLFTYNCCTICINRV